MQYLTTCFFSGYVDDVEAHSTLFIDNVPDGLYGVTVNDICETAFHIFLGEHKQRIAAPGHFLTSVCDVCTARNNGFGTINIAVIAIVQ